MRFEPCVQIVEGFSAFDFFYFFYFSIIIIIITYHCVSVYT